MVNLTHLALEWKKSEMIDCIKNISVKYLNIRLYFSPNN